MATNLGSGYISVIPKMQGNLSSIVGKACSNASATGSAAFQKGFSTTGVMIGNVLATGLNKAISTISSSISSAVTKVDTFERFPTIMQNMGFSADQAASSIDEITQHLQGLPTSATDAVNAVRQFTAMNGDLERSTDIYLALNDALRVGGAGAEEQASAMQMLQRMYATGKVQSRGYVKVLQTMGGTLQEVAEKLGFTSAAIGGDMVDALNSGQLSMDDFMNAIVELDQNGSNGLKSLEERAKEMPLTISEQMTMLHKSVTGSLANIINEIGIDNITGIIGSLGDTFKEVLTAITPVARGVADFLGAIKPAIPTIAKVVGGLILLKGGFGLVAKGASIAVGGFNLIKGGAALAIKPIETLVAKLTAKSLIDGFSTVREAGTVMSGVGSSAANAAKGVSTAGKEISGAGKAVSTAGTAIKTGATKAGSGFKQLAGSALQIVAIGGMIALAGVGFKFMAEGAKEIAEAGPLAAGALAIMGATLAGTVALFVLFGKNLSTSAVGIIAVGGAIAVAAVGLAALGAAAALVGSQGGAGIAALAVMAATMMILVPLFAVFGPALDVATPGILAFGAGVMMAGVGFGVAASGAALFVVALSQLIDSLGEFAVQSGIANNKALEVENAFDGLNVGAGKAFAGIGSAIEGLGAVVAGLGYAVEAAGLTALSWALNEVANATERIQGSAYGAQDGINGIAWASDNAGGALNNLAGTGQSSASQIQGAYDNLSNNIYGVSNQINGSLSGGFYTARDNAINASWDTNNAVLSVFDSLAGALYWKGVNAIDSFANGMRSKIGDAQAVANQAKPNGPSQLSRPYASDYVQVNAPKPNLLTDGSVNADNVRLINNILDFSRNIPSAESYVYQEQQVINNYNFTMDGAVLNDDGQMRDVAMRYVEEWQRKARM